MNTLHICKKPRCNAVNINALFFDIHASTVGGLNVAIVFGK